MSYQLPLHPRPRAHSYLHPGEKQLFKPAICSVISIPSGNAARADADAVCHCGSAGRWCLPTRPHSQCWGLRSLCFHSLPFLCVCCEFFGPKILCTQKIRLPGPPGPPKIQAIPQINNLCLSTWPTWTICCVNSDGKRVENQGFDQFSPGAFASKRVVPLGETWEAQRFVWLFSPSSRHTQGDSRCPWTSGIKGWRWRGWGETRHDQ